MCEDFDINQETGFPLLKKNLVLEIMWTNVQQRKLEIMVYKVFKISTPIHCHYKAWKNQDIFII